MCVCSCAMKRKIMKENERKFGQRKERERREEAKTLVSYKIYNLCDEEDMQGHISSEAACLNLG